MGLAEGTFRVTDGFPKREIYGLSAQMRRAAVSVPSNIAEGFGRETHAHIVNFLRIAQGSLKELETQAVLCQRLGIGNPDELARLITDCDEVGRILYGLIRSKTPAP